MSLPKFIKNMIDVLDIKNIKYKNTWKDVSIQILINKLNRHVKILSTSKDNLVIKKQLIHISNYCYFIYTRLSNF